MAFSAIHNENDRLEYVLSSSYKSYIQQTGGKSTTIRVNKNIRKINEHSSLYRKSNVLFDQSFRRADLSYSGIHFVVRSISIG